MKRAIIIVGPTAVGKTTLAVQISQKIPSILISADSVQVYKGADIISGKDHPEDVKIEFINILPPDKSFSVREFVDMARQLVNQINKTPIFVGGTGLYIKALFENIDTINIPPNKQLRSQLNKLSVELLQEELKKLDSNRFKHMNESDMRNPRRLIRAIEISMIDHTFSESSIFKPEEVVIIGLKTSMEDLRRRIKVRVGERIKMGALDEAKRLFQQYKKLSPQLKTANGYRQMFQFLQSELTWEEAVEKWETSDYQHAKAQMTFFNKLTNIHWFDIGKKGFENRIMELVKKDFHG